MCPDKDVQSAQNGYKAAYDAGKNGSGAPQLNLSFKKGKFGLEGAYKCQKKFKACNERDIVCSK